MAVYEGFAVGDAEDDQGVACIRVVGRQCT